VATLPPPGKVRLLDGLLTLQVLRNSGAAFSIGTSMTIVFSLIAVGVIFFILRTSRRLRAGTVHVNQYDNDDITVPFGGYKQSGNGRDKSLHAFDKYTELKTTWIQVG